MQFPNIHLLAQKYVLNINRVYDIAKGSWISQATSANQKLVL